MKTFAIQNGVKTSARCIAVCDVWSYDVWGSARDGWDVNDRSCIASDAEIPALMSISNVPTHPGASDQFRQFPPSASFNVEVLCSWELDPKSLREYFGAGVVDSGDGDGKHYYVETRAGKPVGEIFVTGWRIAE
jgi:hypothetical protein